MAWNADSTRPESYLRRQPRRRRAEPPPRSGAHLVMLGTRAGPFPSMRAATSTALVVDGHIYLVDAGAGLVQRFYEAGLDFGDIRAMFITHLHSDHVADYFPFFNSNFASWNYESQQIAVLGPDRADLHDPPGAGTRGLPPMPNTEVIVPDDPTPGILEVTDLLFRANAYDLNNSVRTVRRANGVPRDMTGTNGKAMIVPQAIPSPSFASSQEPTPAMDPILVFEDDHVTVTATLVKHPPVFPAWGFRFDTPYGAIVLSGDTAPCANLIKISQGADVLVNEVMALDAALALYAGTEIEETMRRQCVTAHTALLSHGSEADGSRVMGVGELASRASVRALVLNHLYPDNGTVREQDFVEGARSTFAGPVHASDDLDVIDIEAMLACADASRHE